jgi:hypothetical protein
VIRIEENVKVSWLVRDVLGFLSVAPPCDCRASNSKPRLHFFRNIV